MYYCIPPPPPSLWHAHFPTYMLDDLVSWYKPMGGTTKSDLEMASSVLHQNGVSKYFDVRECTVLSRTENMDTMWWHYKGYKTSTSAPDQLLQTQDLHQRFFCYVPYHEFLGGSTMRSLTCLHAPPISLTPNCCTTLAPIYPSHCHEACGSSTATTFPA